MIRSALVKSSGIEWALLPHSAWVSATSLSYAYVGPPPSGGDAWFKYLPGKATVWWVIVGLSVFTDFLFVPLALALYLALKGCNRNAMLLAVALVGLFVVRDLAVTWSHYASILTLYGKYSIATDDVQRTGFLAAANCGSVLKVELKPRVSPT